MVNYFTMHKINPSASTNQEHNDGRNSKIRKELFDRIKARRKLCRNEECGISVLFGDTIADTLHQASSVGERARSTLLDFTPIQSRGSCFEDLHTRINRIANFTDSNLPWELYVPPQRGRRSTISLKHNVQWEQKVFQPCTSL